MPVVTLTIAAACAVINLWLALRVSGGRVRHRIMLGEGESGELRPAARAHANFTEYAPFVLILLLTIELAGGSPRWLWVAGAAFVLARIAHPLGMDRTAPNPLRAGGALVTWIVLALLAGWAAAIAIEVSSAPRVRIEPSASADMPSV